MLGIILVLGPGVASHADAQSVSDFQAIEACLGGPGISRTEICSVFDSDVDQDIDLVDFAGFQPVFPPPAAAALVPASEFQMGSAFDPNDGYTTELPRHAVYLGSYYIDAYETTNAQYAAALNWALSQGSQISIDPWGDVTRYESGTMYRYCQTSPGSTWSQITWDGASFGVVSGKESYPARTISWYGAAARLGTGFRGAIKTRFSTPGATTTANRTSRTTRVNRAATTRSGA